MPTIKISKELNNSMYFVTCTTKNWHYLFDRHNRWDILLDSLKYCQKNKQLKIYSWVFMLNHIHFIASAPDMGGFMRDFKTFTSKELKKNILATEPNIIRLFEENDVFHLWQKSNMPKIIESENYFNQKKQYIEQNPVKKGYVQLPEHWIYSSANTENLLPLQSPN
jgi:putative transposase